METVEDFKAWIDQSDRELQEWLDGLEEESNRSLAWLVEQADIDPLDVFRQ